MSRRRTLDELQMRYQLEPRIQDMYVEGPFDRRFFAWLLQGMGLREINVYEADTVDVPKAIVETYGLSGGARDRVLAIAAELSAVAAINQVFCIIDADYDRILKREPTEPLVLLTDYVCTEMYLLDPYIMRKFFSLVAGLGEAASEQFVAEAHDPLRESFLLRAATSKMKLQFKWIPLCRCCNLSGSTITFDRDDFLLRLLNKNAAINKRDDVERVVGELRANISSDIRHFGHGHDLMELLAWYLVKRNVTSVKGWEGIARSLTGCVEVDQLKKQPLFSTILKHSDVGPHAA